MGALRVCSLDATFIFNFRDRVFDSVYVFIWDCSILDIILS